MSDFGDGRDSLETIFNDLNHGRDVFFEKDRQVGFLGRVLSLVNPGGHVRVPAQVGSSYEIKNRQRKRFTIIN